MQLFSLLYECLGFHHRILIFQVWARDTPARHQLRFRRWQAGRIDLPARALQWQAGRSRPSATGFASGEAGGS